MKSYLPKPYSIQLHLLIVIGAIVLLAPSPTSGLFAQLFNSCFGEKKCGFLGLSVAMYSIQEGTDECIESCVFFRASGLQCGGCPIVKNEDIDGVGYDIYLDLVSIPAADAVFFTNARERWQTIITGDLVNVENATSLSVSSGCRLPAVIDDVYICAAYKRIDGRGGLVGIAGPTFLRPADLLTITGEMQFDRSDIGDLKAGSTFNTVILHEMGHILGTSHLV
jgi:hypothetical protein